MKWIRFILAIFLLIISISCNNTETSFQQANYYPISIMIKGIRGNKSLITYSRVMMRITAPDLENPITVEEIGPFQSGDTVTLTANVPEGNDRLIEVLAYDEEGKPIVYTDLIIDIFEPITKEVYPSIVEWQGTLYKKILYANTTIQEQASNLKYWILNKNMTQINWHGQSNEFGITTAYLAGRFLCYPVNSSDYSCMYIDNLTSDNITLFSYVNYADAELTFTDPFLDEDSILELFISTTSLSYLLNEQTISLTVPTTDLFYSDSEEKIFLTLIESNPNYYKMIRKFNTSLETTIDNSAFTNEGGDVVFICNSTGIYPPNGLTKYITFDNTTSNIDYLTISGIIHDNTNLLDLQNDTSFEIYGIKDNLSLPVSLNYPLANGTCGNYTYNTNEVIFDIPFISDPLLDSYNFTITIYSNSSSIIPNDCYYTDTIIRNYEISNLPSSIDFDMVSSLGNLTILDDNVYSIQIQGISSNSSIDISTYCYSNKTNPSTKILSDSQINPSEYKITWSKLLDNNTYITYSIVTNNISQTINKILDIKSFQINFPKENELEINFQTTDDNSTCSLSITTSQSNINILNFPSSIHYLKVPQFDSKLSLDSVYEVSLECRDLEGNSVTYEYYLH